MYFLRIKMGAIFVLLTMSVGSAYGQELSLMADSQHPYPLNLGGPPKIGADGDLYTNNGNGIIRIKGPMEVEQIFTISGPNSEITLSNPSTWLPQGPISLDGLVAYEVDSVGNLYIAGLKSDNVVFIANNGIVAELITSEGDGKGNTLGAPKDLEVDTNGNVYVIGTNPPSVFKIEPNGNTSLILDASGVQSYPFTNPSKSVIDSDGNIYVASHFAIFKISAMGESSVYLDFGLDRQIRPYESSALTHLNVDDFGNLYFVESRDSSTLYRYSTSKGLERVLGREGDGTGEYECVSHGPSEWSPFICTAYGNPLISIVGIHIDAAQNVYTAGLISRNIFKVTPTNIVSEVVDFSELENFNFERLNSFSMDSIGNLYLVHTKVNGYGTSILSYSPFAVEGQDDFSLETPHSGVMHDANGISSALPSSYTLTRYSQDDVLPDELAHLDTRAAAFSALPWQEGTTTTQGGADSGAEVIRTTLSHEGHLYEAQMQVSVRNVDRSKHVNSISYTVDGVQRYLLSGLELPLEIYSRYMNQSLMSWLYLGNDVISGGPRADILLGYEGHDILYGNGGDDLLDGSSGANIYYGGDGFDTVVYERRRADYMLSKNPVNGFVSVQAKTGQGSPYIDLVAPDTERLRFSDGDINTAQLSYWGELKSAESTSTDAPPVNVYRFFNTKDNAFFYSTNPDERTMVLRNSGPNNKSEVDWPYVYQGAKFQTAHTYQGAVPLYRFYNTQTGHHFFTINEDERANILAQIRDAGWPFVDEGIAFEVYADDPTPFEVGRERAVYRYYSWSLNRHLFTSSEEEASLLDISSEWTYEGIGFYAEALQ